MEKTDDASARSQILTVTTRLLLAKEADAITVREIASQAGVNAAAVNYYFRSKENLIDEAVLSATAAAFAQGKAVLTNRAVKPRARLLSFFEGYAKGLVEFKGITRTAFRTVLMREQGGDRYAVFFRELLGETAGIFRELGAPPAEATAKALGLYSAVAFPFLVMGSLQNFAGFDYANAEARREYIRSLVETSTGGKEPQHG